MVFRLALQAILNTLLVFAMDRVIPQYFTLLGGWEAFAITGVLLTLLNLLVRPMLTLLTFPLKLVATLAATILVNGVMLWLLYRLSLLMDPDLLVLVIRGGIGGWIVVSIVLGLANWLMKLVLR